MESSAENPRSPSAEPMSRRTALKAPAAEERTPDAYAKAELERRAERMERMIEKARHQE